MARGKESLYENILQPITEQIIELKSEHKGRNELLMARRNSGIVHRYVYYIKFHELKYEPAINKISNEFFLASRTVMDILGANQNEIKKVRDTVKEIKQFKDLFAFLDWIPKK